MRTITSRQNPVVATFRAAVRSSRRERRHVVLDGPRLIDEACTEGVPIDTAILSAEALSDGDSVIARLAHDLEAKGVDTLAVSASVLSAVSPLRTPSGAVALAAYEPATWQAVVARVRSGLVVAATGVQDPGNLGAIVRTADAGGAEGVVVTETSADPYGWRALRGAMGSTFRVPVAVVSSVDAMIATAREEGGRILAAVPRGGVPLYDADLDGPRLLLVGPEGEGLDARLEETADVRVSVPMRSPVDSLNVSVAVALMIYEARWQRARGRPR